MPEETSSPEPIVQYPPVVRTHLTPTAPAGRLPALRRPGELSVPNLVLASGIALALEAVRLAIRARRKRSVDTQHDSTPGQVIVSYEWTHVTYERYERS